MGCASCGLEVGTDDCAHADHDEWTKARETKKLEAAKRQKRNFGGTLRFTGSSEQIWPLENPGFTRFRQWSRRQVILTKRLLTLSEPTGQGVRLNQKIFLRAFLKAEARSDVAIKWGMPGEQHSSCCIGRWKGRVCGVLLNSGNGFVLQDTHDHTTILGLSFRGSVFAHLVAFSHCTGCQHSGQRNMSFLNKNIDHLVGPVFA